MKGHTMRALLAIALVAITVGSLQAQRPANDWPQWRGPNRDGAAPAVADANAWPEKLTQKWKVEVGLGYATPLIVGNRIYQFARQGDREVRSGIDAGSGKGLWRTEDNAPCRNDREATLHGRRPLTTPVFT